MDATIGWDIGGANTKACIIQFVGGKVKEQRIITSYFEMWQKSDSLVQLLGEISSQLGTAEQMGVTITAELSDAFRSKKEGIHFILDSLQEAFPQINLHILDVHGEFLSLEQAKQAHLSVAAANWVAAALLVSQQYPNCLLMDIGSTTVDLIPVIGGTIATQGNNDLARLQSGELVYTGILRTNVNTIVQEVPVRGRFTRVAAEHFAVTGDVHLILGNIKEAEYTCSTPDNRATTREFAGERLARLTCADAEMLTVDEIERIARYIQEKQIQSITESMMQVLSRLPGGYQLPLVTSGLGQFLGQQCGQRLGLQVIPWENVFSGKSAVVAPSFATAVLLAQKLEELK
jgi:probable H4MPT-linked C1 transfer pathway protein